MNKEEYELTLRQSYTVLMMAGFIRERLPEAIRLAEKSHSLGALTNPTLWIQHQAKLSEDIQVMKSVLSLAQLHNQALQSEKQPAS